MYQYFGAGNLLEGKLVLYTLRESVQWVDYRNAGWASQVEGHRKGAKIVFRVADNVSHMESCQPMATKWLELEIPARNTAWITDQYIT